jgi:hypothetical protein
VTTVTGTGPLEMKLLAAKLHGADAELKKQLRRQFRQAAAPVVAAVKASILSAPSHHDGTLRKEIARTVSARSSIRQTGVALDIVSAGSRMPAGKTNLAGAADQARGWRHPVFGTEAQLQAHLDTGGRARHGAGWTWVSQTLKPGWFEDPVIAQGHNLRRAAEQAMNDTARKLA